MSESQPTDWDSALIAAGYIDRRGGSRPSWRQLAQAVGVHQSTLAYMRDGTRETEQSTVDAVAAALMLDPRTVAEWVGRARTERTPFKPHEDANLLDHDERAAVNRIIALLAESKKRGHDAGPAEAEKTLTEQRDVRLAAQHGPSAGKMEHERAKQRGEESQDDGTWNEA